MIALAQRWQQMEADHEAAADRLDTAWRAKDDAAHDAIDAEIEALCDRKRELLDEILATPARSLVGIVAKLSIAATVIGKPDEWIDDEDHLALAPCATPNG